MFLHMRTTINLPDGLGEEAKRSAARRGCTFTELVVEGLHRILYAPETDKSPQQLPRYGGGEGHVLVDLTDRTAVAEALDADRLR